SSMLPPPLGSPLFPYTTLFRSQGHGCVRNLQAGPCVDTVQSVQPGACAPTNFPEVFVRVLCRQSSRITPAGPATPGPTPTDTAGERRDRRGVPPALTVLGRVAVVRPAGLQWRVGPRVDHPGHPVRAGRGGHGRSGLAEPTSGLPQPADVRAHHTPATGPGPLPGGLRTAAAHRVRRGAGGGGFLRR